MVFRVRARFFGGPADGNVQVIDRSLLNGCRIPEPVEVTAIAAAFDVPLGLLGPKIHLYCWDGTINDAGERRMRWRP